MASNTYIQVQNHQGDPMSGIDVEAIDVNEIHTNYPGGPPNYETAIVATATTDNAGVATFTLTGQNQYFFRPRIHVHPDVRIQVLQVQKGLICYNAVVIPSGGGTHATLQAAVDYVATLTAPVLQLSGNRHGGYILLCGLVDETITIPNIADGVTIYIEGRGIQPRPQAIAGTIVAPFGETGGAIRRQNTTSPNITFAAGLHTATLVVSNIDIVREATDGGAYEGYGITIPKPGAYLTLRDVNFVDLIWIDPLYTNYIYTTGADVVVNMTRCFSLSADLGVGMIFIQDGALFLQECQLVCSVGDGIRVGNSSQAQGQAAITIHNSTIIAGDGGTGTKKTIWLNPRANYANPSALRIFNSSISMSGNAAAITILIDPDVASGNRILFAHIVNSHIENNGVGVGNWYCLRVNNFVAGGYLDALVFTGNTVLSTSIAISAFAETDVRNSVFTSNIIRAGTAQFQNLTDGVNGKVIQHNAA